MVNRLVLLVFVSVCIYNNILRITTCFFIKIALSKLSVCDSRVDRMWRHLACFVYYDKICIKFTSHHLLLYVVYMCQKSLNFIYAFKCYQQNVSGFTLAGPPCRYKTAVC